jgi:poly-gamma-glutamate synthesis protein (capsule biosynthesis protein)
MASPRRPSPSRRTSDVASGFSRTSGTNFGATRNSPSPQPADPRLRAERSGGQAGPRALVLVASDWAPIRAFDPIVRDTPEAIYGDLLPLLRRADLRVVNCECALTRASKAAWKSGAVFKGEPAHVGGLTAVPFDVACLANNHVLDYGVAGLRETLRVLEGNGVHSVGAGLTEEAAHAPLSLTRGGVRVHIVNFSEGEDLTTSRGGPGVFGWEIERAADLVRRCKEAGGAVIAIGHCGLEYVPYPPPYVVEAFRAIADAGADVVIGHHPHVPQGLEWHNGRLIVYSLGNFVFYQPTDLHYRKVGFCVTLRFEAEDPATGHRPPATGHRLAANRRVRASRACTLADASLHPYCITDAGLRRLDDKQDREFRRTLAEISKPFATPGGPARAWEAYVEYYGRDGFTNEVIGILERMNTEPEKGAAMFRNRVTTMQHAELWRDALTRIMRGPAARPFPGARAVVEEWFSRRTGDG